MNSVLVIENDAMTRAAIRNLLKLQWPHLAVLVAEDGPKGLHIAQKMQPDLILLEYALPVLDGYQTAKVLRHLPETRAIPLIALTQPYQTPNAKVIGLQEACHAWVAKPIEANELIETISTIQMKRYISG